MNFGKPHAPNYIVGREVQRLRLHSILLRAFKRQARRFYCNCESAPGSYKPCMYSRLANRAFLGIYSFRPEQGSTFDLPAFVGALNQNVCLQERAKCCNLRWTDSLTFRVVLNASCPSIISSHCRVNAGLHNNLPKNTTPIVSSFISRLLYLSRYVSRTQNGFQRSRSQGEIAHLAFASPAQTCGEAD